MNRHVLWSLSLAPCLLVGCGDDQGTGEGPSATLLVGQLKGTGSGNKVAPASLLTSNNEYSR